MIISIVFGIIILSLLIIDIIRITLHEPARIEIITLLYLPIIFFIGWFRINPQHIISMDTLYVLLITIALSGLHFLVTVINFWITLNKFSLFRTFKVIGYMGVLSIFLINGYLILK